MGDIELRARVAVDGEVPPSDLVYTTEPLSLWGGFDPASGRVTDRHHPLRGRRLAGTVLALPAGRGSGTSSAVLLEAIRAGTAPCAIVFQRLDPVFAAGVLVGEELYGRSLPLLVLESDGQFARLGEAARARIDRGGLIRLFGTAPDVSS